MTVPGKSQFPKAKYRTLMEEHLGRELRTDEHVHHKNGDHADNRIENLEVMSRDDHLALHGRERSLVAQALARLEPDERATVLEATTRRFVSVGEVAKMLGVTTKTVRRWEQAGRIPTAMRTPTGYRRWYAGDIEDVMNEVGTWPTR